MHLQEKTLFDPCGHGQTKCCPILSTSCDLCICKVRSFLVLWFRRRFIFKKIHYLTLVVKVTPNVAQNTLHLVTDALAKLEASKSYGSGGDSFSRKYII